MRRNFIKYDLLNFWKPKEKSWDFSFDYNVRLKNRLCFGFTLVELLVAIGIAGIVAAIGLTVFTGLQRGGRDAARKQDVLAIAKANTTNYNISFEYYPTIQQTWFAGGSIPQDPQDTQTACAGNMCAYCIDYQTGGNLPNPAGTLVNNNYSCGSVNPNGNSGHINKSAVFSAPANATGFVVCANLETGGGNVNGGTTFCQGSQR